MLNSTLDIPNKPVKRGTNGSLSSRFKTISPRTPVSINAKNAEGFLLSAKITFKETKVNTRGNTRRIKFPSENFSGFALR